MKFSGLMGAFSSDFAVDLGTANTRIYARGRGIVLNEPSIVAIRMVNGLRSKAIAFGSEAKDMQGKTPADITLVHPIRDGVIADFEAIAALLKFFIRKVQSRHKFLKPKIVFAVPNAITEVEKRAIRETAEMVGVREAPLVSGPIAAAIGAGMPVMDATCSLIVDIGAGKTEAAAISLLGIVQCRSIPSSGDKMDFIISQYLKNSYDLLVGEHTAENIKSHISCLTGSGHSSTRIDIRGRDTNSGIPKILTVPVQEMWASITGQIDAIATEVKTVLENIPPELSADVIDRGIILTGGVAMLDSIGHYLAKDLCINVAIAAEPMSSAVMGAGHLLEQEGLLPRVSIA
jgi:rod shape-determining protein MreB